VSPQIQPLVDTRVENSRNRNGLRRDCEPRGARHEEKRGAKGHNERGSHGLYCLLPAELGGEGSKSGHNRGTTAYKRKVVTCKEGDQKLLESGVEKSQFYGRNTWPEGGGGLEGEDNQCEQK